MSKDNFIFKMEVTETSMPKLMNWLGEFEEIFEDNDFKEIKYELFFATFEEMNEKIDDITEGFNQYWADVTWDLHDNNDEWLEYHNGHGEWDKEIIISTSRLYLTESFWKALENHKINN